MRVIVQNQIQFIASAPEDMVYQMHAHLPWMTNASFMHTVADDWNRYPQFIIDASTPMAFLRTMEEHGLILMA